MAKTKRNIISKLSEVGEAKNNTGETAKYPILVQRRLRGYNTASVLFIVFGLLSWIMTKSFLSALFGFIIAVAVFALGIMQKKKLADEGIENWRFRVIEHTKLTRMNRRPTGFYAEALDGKYEGNICHIALTGTSVVPFENQVVELCVPGGMEASLIRDVVYIPQYYGMTFVNE